MSHETESPAPVPGNPHREVDNALPFQSSPTAPPPKNDGEDEAQEARGHVMSPGVPHLPRPQTISGIGTEGDVPADPFVPVGLAPAAQSASATARARGAEAATHAGRTAAESADATALAVYAPKPRPSETMVGSQSPLHTAEDANTAVDLASMSELDADRILAAADADAQGLPKRGPTLLSPVSGLPPPPPLRKSAFPPSSRLSGLSAGFDGHLYPRPPHPTPPPPRTGSNPPARSSYPPPPPRRGNTLLLYGGPGTASSTAEGPSAADPQDSKTDALEGGSIRARAAGRRAPSAPDGAEELSSGFLVDDSGELPTSGIGASYAPGVPQPISSSSLVEDPPSNPDLDLEAEPPPLAPLAPAFVPPPFVPPPFVPPPRFGSAPSFLPPPPPVRGVARDSLRESRGFEGGETRPDAAGAPPGPRIGESPRPIAVAAPRGSTPPLGSSGASIVARDPFKEGPATWRPPPVESRRSARSERPPWLYPLLAVVVAAVCVAGVGALAFTVPSTRAVAAKSVGTSTSQGISSASQSSPRASSPPPTDDRPDSKAGGAVKVHDLALAGLGAGPGNPCVLAGAPHIVMPRAVLRAGIETASSPERIALGVALGERDGFTVALDPSTFVAVGTGRARSTDPLRRVVPVFSASSEVTPFLETTRRRKDLEAAHPVLGDAHDPPFVVGVADGHLAWAPSRTSPSTPLWALNSETPVDAVRVVVLPDRQGYAVAFRQASSIYLGGLHADKTVNGGLARIGALGPQVGAPTLAAGKDHVLVAWADRASPATSWGIRWLAWHPGNEPPAPSAFPVPVGGGGGQVMSPSLASLAGGRFVMAWTEGAGGRHQVRAEALDGSEQPIGTALTVSADGVNAGEGTPALTPDGRGAIVFFATPTGTTASVVAVPVICPGGT